MKIKGKCFELSSIEPITQLHQFAIVELSPAEFAEQLKPDISRIKEGDEVWVKARFLGKEIFKGKYLDYCDIIAHFPQPENENCPGILEPQPLEKIELLGHLERCVYGDTDALVNYLDYIVMEINKLIDRVNRIRG